MIHMRIYTFVHIKSIRAYGLNLADFIATPGRITIILFALQ